MKSISKEKLFGNINIKKSPKILTLKKIVYEKL